MASQGTQGLLGLSDEVLVLVLSFLQSDGDLLNCSRVCRRLRKLASDKSLVRRLSFRRDVLLNKENLKFFFSIPSTCAKVVSLNLNGVYWIAPSAVQAQILKMRNLEELHVGDILFSPKQFSSLVSRLSKLTKLSLTWHWVEVADVQVITSPELGSVYSQLQHLNLYLATGDRCPLDKVTWLLALCRDLTHLSVLSQTVHREVQSSINRFNIVISTREFALPSLNTVIWNIRNESYPSLLVSEVKQRLRNCLSQRSSQFITNQTRLFSKRSQQCLKVSEIQQQPSDCQERGLCLYDNEGGDSFPLSMYKNLAELCSHSNLPSWLVGWLCPSAPDDTFKTLEKISFLFYDRLRLQLPIGNMKRLRHLEIRDLVRGLTSADTSGVLDGLASSAPQLETLILCGAPILASNDKVIFKLLQSCQNLTHLELSDLGYQPQRLFTDLESGLKEAKGLKTLKIKQKQLTQYSPRLLESLSENCDSIEQVVLVDTSRAFTLKKYPTEAVFKLSQKKSVKFVYICSELLTLEDDKFVKRKVKSLLEEKPFLLVRLQLKVPSNARLLSLPFYSVDNISDLPMEFQSSVASLYVDFNMRASTSVASLTVGDIF